MRGNGIFNYTLAVFLNLAPLARTAVSTAQTVTSPVAMLIRWAFGAAAVAGSFHGVSAASSITPTSATATNGVAFVQKFLMNTHYGVPQSCTATGLPPGLSIVPTGPSLGIVNGIPTQTGTFYVSLTGYERKTFSGHTYGGQVTIKVVASGLPPTVVISPSTLQIVEGQLGTLTGVPGGTPPFSWQWSKAGVAIGGATNSSLSFNPAKLSDAGSYTVQASNPSGTADSSAASVVVTPAAPVFTQQPKSFAVHADEATQFSLIAASSVPYTLQWFHDDKPVANGTNAVLAIASAQPTNAGVYYARATNSSGTTESTHATMTVGGRLEMLGTIVDSSGRVVLSFMSLPGRTYAVDSRPGIGASGGLWTPLATGIAGTGSKISVRDPVSDPGNDFYRVRTTN